MHQIMLFPETKNSINVLGRGTNPVERETPLPTPIRTYGASILGFLALRPATRIKNAISYHYYYSNSQVKVPTRNKCVQVGRSKFCLKGVKYIQNN